MKYLAVFVAIFAFQIYEFADANGGQAVRCANYCLDNVDFSNIELAISRGKCSGQINLAGFKSAVNTVRSLVCRCDSNHQYVPRTNKCVQLYNCDIIIPVVQVAAPGVITDIYNGVNSNVCEAIQLIADNLSNVYQGCIGGALSFQGDHTNGKQVAHFVHTCYNSTVLDLTQAIDRFNEEVPGSGDPILNSVITRFTPLVNVYHGTEFHQCLGTLAGQTIEICDSNRSEGGILGLVNGLLDGRLA